MGSYVFWNYNGKIITYDRERGGTVVISEKREQTTSSLIITHATSKDSGQYECDPSASYPQHVNVHVIKRGDPSDAVRRSSSGGPSIITNSPTTLITFTLITTLITSLMTMTNPPSTLKRATAV